MSSASTIFDNALAIAKADIIVSAAPALVTFFTNINKSGTPSPIVLITQLDLLRSSLMAAVPNLEQTEISQINGSFINAVEGELANAQAVIAKANTATTELKAPAPAPAAAATGAPTA